MTSIFQNTGLRIESTADKKVTVYLPIKSGFTSKKTAQMDFFTLDFKGNSLFSIGVYNFAVESDASKPIDLSNTNGFNFAEI